MKLLSYVSELLMPFLILYVVGYGLASRRDIYGDFMEGAKDGLKTAAGICPTLIGLMTAVGILRVSGFLGLCGRIAGKTYRKDGDALGDPAAYSCADVFVQCSSKSSAGYFQRIWD